MALNAVLVDQARVIRQEGSALKVRGATVFTPSRSQWFKCRLTLPAAQESVDPGYRRRVVLVPTLLYGMRDKDGLPIDLSIEDRLEVSSRELGQTLWDVVSAPEPLRKKRRLLGWQATLRRVEDAELPDAAVGM